MGGMIIIKIFSVCNVFITAENAKIIWMSVQNVMHLQEEEMTLPTVLVISVTTKIQSEMIVPVAVQTITYTAENAI